MKPIQTLERACEGNETPNVGTARFEARKRPIAEAVTAAFAVGSDDTGTDGSRRDFLRRSAGVGIALGMSPLLATCGSDDPAPDQPPVTEARTLFFNFAHHSQAARSHYLTGGGDRYELVRVVDRPDVLARERLQNRFLRAVPDDQITHHVEGVVTPNDSVTVFYSGADIDPVVGTWSMSSVFLSVPSSGASHAYQRARAIRPAGPLPLSAKRKLYGIPAAETEQDLREEGVLIDTAALAAALVGMHPDLLSLEPNSAHNIQTNYVNTSIDVVLLSEKLRRAEYGAAMPQTTPDMPNTSGWGTLVPVLNDGPSGIGGVIRNVNGKNKGRIQYQPILHKVIAASVGPAIGTLTPAVKNDATLGADITGVTPTDTPTAYNGAVWFRQDGSANVDQSPGKAIRDSAAVMTLKQVGPQNGLDLLVSSATNPDNTVQVYMTVRNWYVRFLGVYLQFFNDKDPNTPIPLKSIPEYNAGKIVAGHDTNNGIDTDDSMFVAVLGPIFTILGIPTWPGFIQPNFTVPSGVNTVRILSSGLSFGTSNPYADTVLPGAIMTGIINYGMTAVLAGCGAAAGLSVMMKEVVVPFANALAQELIVIFSNALNQKGYFTPGFWEAQGLGTAKFLLGFATGQAVGALVKWIVGDVTVSILEDEIPIAGLIMLAISVVAGAATILETSIELAYSPWTYVDDLVFTHDLGVSLLPDPNDSTFPKGADHYKVTALFDDGTPHVKTLPLTSLQPPLPAIVFTGVPLGGQVNVSASFSQAGSPDVLLGKGTTGLVPNTLAAPVPPLPIQEVKYPIGPGTTYRHQQKTGVDATGQHVWNVGAPAPTINAGTAICSNAGTICDRYSITVRQGTSNPKRNGYVGYSWRSWNTQPSNPALCPGIGVGQLDQIANLNTDDASTGYTVIPCGIDQPGVRVAYNLLSQGSSNFYLDTSIPNTPIVRQVILEPSPSFDGPKGNRAWGVLNFSSDALLLHPAGHLISISQAAHKMETHKLPPASQTDADAMTGLVAQVKSGQGTLPGLMTAPVTAAVAPDGTILVVEAGNTQQNPPIPNRIQAFDIGANPVRFFTGQPATPYFLPLVATPNTAGWRHLDLAVEFSGFIYLLSYNENTLVYRLDIYHPGQSGTTPISTTTNVNAARLAIDFWRNVYTLNYEVLPLPGPGVTEPTVSLWVPTQSCTGYDCVPS